MTRRELLAAAAACLGCSAERPAPIRRITQGPKHHWFGYYDKLEFDPTSRFALGMEVDFEHRSPRPEDVIRIGVIDTEEGDGWRELGTSSAWCWQQGCMLQWIPGSTSEIVWNDREQGRYVSRVLDVESGESRTLPLPVYALSPDGTWAVSIDLHSYSDTRPGYRYAGLADLDRERPAPEDNGIWRMDMATGERELIFSVAEATAIPNSEDGAGALKGFFNHALVSPDGARIVFLHRWKYPPGSERGTGRRVFTTGADGSDPHVVDPYGRNAHFIWRDPEHILGWAYHPSHGDAFYLYRDQSDEVEAVALEAMPLNGHCSYLPDNRWILNDTYPDENRLQHAYLYEPAAGRRTPLADLRSPPEYQGEWRCDLHPRCSPDGRKVVDDSPHGGDGRQMYLIDISGIVG